MADTHIILGDFVFSNYEIPDQITYGGEQGMHVHQLIGGKRIVDTMGANDSVIKWSGRFQGEDAIGRARALDYVRRLGSQLQFQFGTNSWQVVIKSIKFDFQRVYQIPYEIELCVVQDEGQQDAQVTNENIDNQINADESLMTDSLTSVQFPPPTDVPFGMPVDIAAVPTGLSIADITGITTAVGAVQDALGAVNSFEQATIGQIQSILDPINQARDLVQSTRAAVDQVVNMNWSGGLAGVVSGMNALQVINSINGSFVQTTNLLNLNVLDASMGHMAGNLTQ